MTLYKILHLLFFSLVRILCALRTDSRKKMINMVLMRDLWNFSFVGRRLSHQSIHNSVDLFRGHRRITPGLNARNNFVKKIFVCIGHRSNVLARCDSNFPLLRCQGVWNKTCTQLSHSQIFFHKPKNYSLRDVQRFCYHS